MAAATCPFCRKRYAIRPELAGRRVKCTACGNAFTIARHAGPVAAAPSSKPAAPAPPLADSSSPRSRRLPKRHLAAGAAGALIVGLLLGLLLIRSPQQPDASSGQISHRRPSVSYEGLVQQHGAEQVVRITVILPDWDRWDWSLIERIDEALRQSGATSSGYRAWVNRVEYVAAPIADLDELARRLEAEAAPAIDRASRIITLRVEAAKPPADDVDAEL